ncbi:MAG TPA: hypothetical protein VG759_17165 [Candidatus Angelobacter sp.]|jgi:hypothetical protein|nr:hypothetical protein [Candidatus Angelobacter sp.]
MRRKFLLERVLLPDKKLVTVTDNKTESKPRTWEVIWSIAIYSGPSPLALSPAPESIVPTITREHITDVQASFVADPFMVREGNQWILFFEVLNAGNRRGEIGLATSRDAFHWQYQGIVLREPFHLSYPYVFLWNGEYYMVPETLDLGCIQLYRAVQFPTQWERCASLVPGVYADPTVFRHDGRWWMFACGRPRRHDEVALFHADDLRGPWMPHPQNPLIKGDPRRARPAGRVIAWNGGVLRLAQDCVPEYGTQVRAFAVSELTPQTYREIELPESPLLSPGKAWNADGMHHMDAHQLEDGKWIACVDGYETRWFD